MALQQFRFLSSRAIVAGCLLEESHIPNDTESSGRRESLDIYTFSGVPTDEARDGGLDYKQTGLYLVASLCLPPLGWSAKHHSIDIGTSPSDLSGLIIVTPYWGNSATDRDFMSGFYRMVTTPRSLLKYLDEYEMYGQSKTVPWMEWGQDMTRIFAGEPEVRGIETL